MTGSMVSSLQGEPRSTHDADIVIVLTANKITQLIEAFPSPDYYLSADAVKDAIQRHSMFNLISSSDGFKVDFWLLTDEPFDQSRFNRRRPIKFDDLDVMASAPEDTILIKLRWAKMLGGSEKQLLDAIRIYEVQVDQLDNTYLNEWAKRLDLMDDLEELKKRAVR